MKDIVAQKKCTKCLQVKPASEFFANKSAKDGLFSTCKVCELERLRKWRAENPEKLKEQNRKNYYRHREDRIKKVMEWAKRNKDKASAAIDRWHKNNREKGLEANRKSAIKHKDEVRERKKKYRANNPDKVLVWTNNRRLRLSCNNEKVEVSDWIEVKEKFGNKCLCCKRTDVKLTMDHVIPVSLGGRNIIENIQPLCGSCNSAKSVKVIDYRK